MLYKRVKNSKITILGFIKKSGCRVVRKGVLVLCLRIVKKIGILVESVTREIDILKDRGIARSKDK